MFPGFKMSRRYLATYPDVGFGIALVTGCRDSENPPDFIPYKRKLLRAMRKRETLSRISRRIDTYAAFFESFGHECPLVGHLKRTIHSGFPQYSLFVDAHFMAEMCAGILVAVTDLACFDGALTLDTAEAGETCAGMGGRNFLTREGEIVLRDEKEVVCVLCQGADEKTRVSRDTRQVLFYAYAVPGIERRHLEKGLATAAETVALFGGGRIEGVKVY